jgi:hypothetical protein
MAVCDRRQVKNHWAGGMFSRRTRRVRCPCGSAAPLCGKAGPSLGKAVSLLGGIAEPAERTSTSRSDKSQAEQERSPASRRWDQDGGPVKQIFEAIQASRKVLDLEEGWNEKRRLESRGNVGSALQNCSPGTLNLSGTSIGPR